MSAFGFLLAVGCFLWILTQFLEKIAKVFGKLPADAPGTPLHEGTSVAPVVVVASVSSSGSAGLLVPTQAVRLPKASVPLIPALQAEQPRVDNSADNEEVDQQSEAHQADDQTDDIPFGVTPLQDADEQAEYEENFIPVTTYEGILTDPEEAYIVDDRTKEELHRDKPFGQYVDDFLEVKRMVVELAKLVEDHRTVLAASQAGALLEKLNLKDMTTDVNAIKMIDDTLSKSVESISAIAELSDHLESAPIDYVAKLAEHDALEFIDDFFEQMGIFDSAGVVYRSKASKGYARDKYNGRFISAGSGVAAAISVGVFEGGYQEVDSDDPYSGG